MPVLRTSPRPRRGAARRAFTLLEALMAAGILLVTVMAVTGAIAAGQQQAQEARLRIAGTMAAEELLGRIILDPYDDLATWNGHREAVGAMTLSDGDPMPDTFAAVGREVVVRGTDIKVADLGVMVRGRTVAVTAFDVGGRALVTLERFVAEPAS